MGVRPHFFDRTSTFRVLEFFLEQEITSFDQLIELFHKKGHKRTDSDIKRMYFHLERINVIKNWEVNYRFLDIDHIKESSTDPFVVKKIIEMIDFLQSQNLMVIPFLKAVHAVPNQRGLICARASELCRELGYFHVRIDRDDNASAMKNFMAFMKLMVTEKGKYELTILGKEVMKHYTKPNESTLQRAKCNRDVCREVCPADVIDAFTISNSCIQCGLCIKACPYGGIEIVDNRYKIFPNICVQNSGTRKKTHAGPIAMLVSDELVFQNWLKELFKFGKWDAYIPGGGHYIDVVVATKPIWIECKIKNITNKSVEKVIKQIKEYQEEEVIEKTKEKVLRDEKVEIQTPELYLLCAPEKSDVKKFLEKSNDLEYPTGFLSIEAMHKVSDYLVRSNNLDWNENFPNNKENIDFSRDLK